MSIQDVDLFFWGQNRFAAFVSALASPIANPDANLFACLLINAVSFHVFLLLLAYMGTWLVSGTRSLPGDRRDVPRPRRRLPPRHLAPGAAHPVAGEPALLDVVVADLRRLPPLEDRSLVVVGARRPPRRRRGRPQPVDDPRRGVPRPAGDGSPPPVGALAVVRGRVGRLVRRLGAPREPVRWQRRPGPGRQPGLLQLQPQHLPRRGAAVAGLGLQQLPHPATGRHLDRLGGAAARPHRGAQGGVPGPGRRGVRLRGGLLGRLHRQPVGLAERVRAAVLLPDHPLRRRGGGRPGGCGAVCSRGPVDGVRAGARAVRDCARSRSSWRCSCRSSASASPARAR